MAEMARSNAMSGAVSARALKGLAPYASPGEAVVQSE